MRFRVHLELFARGLVLLVPAGIGVAPPVERDGAYVLGGRCLYPLRTREPTGVSRSRRRGRSASATSSASGDSRSGRGASPGSARAPAACSRS